MELVEERETVVHVLKGEVIGADAGALVDLAAGACGVRFHLVEGGQQAARSGVAGRVIEDVDGLLLHVLRAFGRGEEVGPGHHDRDVVVEQVGRLGDPAGSEVVLGDQFLGPVLGPVSLGEPEPVAARVLHEGGHHLVRLAVPAAVLGELKGRAVRGGTAPELGDRRGAGDSVAGVGAALVVAALEVVPALDDEAGVGQSVSDGLGGHVEGIRHAAGTVHRELNVGQFRHVGQQPLGAELGDAVERVVGLIEALDHVHRQRLARLPERAGCGDGDNDQTVDLIRRDAGVVDRLAQRVDGDCTDAGLRPAVPSTGCRRMADADGGDLAAVLPDAEPFVVAVHRVGSGWCRHVVLQGKGVVGSVGVSWGQSSITRHSGTS